jgi:hypothetical protein
MLLTVTVALLAGPVGFVVGPGVARTAPLITMAFSGGRSHITQEETHDARDHDIPHFPTV